jgi:hypothetical protein
VLYDFAGFFQPVDNGSTLNTVKAGSGVGVKFSLAGNQGLGVLAAGSPSAPQVACASDLPVDAIEETTTSPAGLTYDAAAGQYVYVWKTNKSWAGTCRTLIVGLIDGSEHSASFKFS